MIAQAHRLCGAQTEQVLVQAVELDVRADGLGPLDHLVSVRPDAEGWLMGLVVLFGRLAFVVRLSSEPITASVASSCYRVNQIPVNDRTGPDRLDDPRDLAIVVPRFDLAATRNHEEFQETAVRTLRAVLSDVLEQQRSLHLRRIIAPIWERACARVEAVGPRLRRARARPPSSTTS